MWTQIILYNTALLISPLLLAQQSSCDGNMNQLATDSSGLLEQLPSNTRIQIEKHIQLAVEAQAAGNQQQCILHSNMALQAISRASTPKDLNFDIIEQ